MYYVFLFSISMLLAGCFEQVGADPITSANGLTFMSSRLPAHSSQAGVSDTLASKSPQQLECSAEQSSKQFIPSIKP